MRRPIRHLGAPRWQGANVTFPARQFTIGGDRRTFSLLRYVDNPVAQDRLREFLLQAYQAHVQEQAAELEREQARDVDRGDDAVGDPGDTRNGYV